MHVQEKVILITGAAGDIGSRVARAFGDQGALLALVDVKPDRLKDQCGALVVDHDALLLGGVDATDEGQVNNMVEDVIEHYERIDGLINIAGGYRAGDPAHETSVNMWDFMMDLNAKSAFLTSRAVAPHMIEQESGHIVNFGARPAIEGGSANSAAYGASKAAVIRLTESMYKELKGHGINVNAVVPSNVDTPGNREAMPDANFEKWVKPMQIAEVLLFLMSDASTAINGSAITMYGYA